MSHRNQKDLNQAIMWARKILYNKEDYILLDTETTGLSKTSVAIQVGVTDMDGNVLFLSLLKPTEKKRISIEATEVHGIKTKDLKDSPSFREMRNSIQETFRGKKVIIYNKEFDERILIETAIQDGCDFLEFHSVCAMEMYAQFCGSWSDYHQSYTWRKLPYAKHGAIGDCKAIIRILKIMAETTIIKKIPKPTPVIKRKPVYVIDTINKKKWYESYPHLHWIILKYFS